MPNTFAGPVGREAANHHGSVFEETRLMEWCKRTGNSYRDLADAIGASRSQIKRVVCGTAIPSLIIALAIEIITDHAVPVSYWTTTRVGKEAWELIRRTATNPVPRSSRTGKVLKSYVPPGK